MPLSYGLFSSFPRSAEGRSAIALDEINNIISSRRFYSGVGISTNVVKPRNPRETLDKILAIGNFSDTAKQKLNAATNAELDSLYSAFLTLVDAGVRIIPYENLLFERSGYAFTVATIIAQLNRAKLLSSENLDRILKLTEEQISAMASALIRLNTRRDKLQEPAYLNQDNLNSLLSNADKIKELGWCIYFLMEAKLLTKDNRAIIEGLTKEAAKTLGNDCEEKRVLTQEMFRALVNRATDYEFVTNENAPLTAQVTEERFRCTVM